MKHLTCHLKKAQQLKSMRATLLSNDPCWGKLSLSLGLTANFLIGRLYYRTSFGLCSSVGGNHKIVSDRLIVYVSLALV